MAGRRVPAAPPYHPLYGPTSTRIQPASVDTELWLARDFLSETAQANVHERAAMIQAAVGLYCRLAALVAAMDSERGVK